MSATHAGPLTGIRVVEIAGIGPVPHACMILADLGAEVIRVERPGAPRVVAPRNDIVLRGRGNQVLDLKESEGVNTVLDLVADADVLVEGFRPGVMERLGLGPSRCHERNPRLTYARMTGWGQDGPLSSTAGHDLTYLALSGALFGLGQGTQQPQFPGNLLGDYGGGSTYLVIGILSSLLESARSGRGQVVDAAIVDGVTHLNAIQLSLLADGQSTEEEPHHALNGGAPFYAVYETADGRHMAVGALEPQFFSEFVRLLAVEEECPSQTDTAAYPRMRALFEAKFAQRTQADWTATFDGSDACVSPVLAPSEAALHPHLRARRVYVTHDGVLQPAPAPRFSRTPAVMNGLNASSRAHSF